MISALVLLSVAGVELDWLAPEPGCPSQAEVQRRLEAALPAESDVAVRARVEAVEAQWLLRLETRVEDERGSRELLAPDCAALGDAAVLLVTMAARGRSSPAAPEAPSLEPTTDPTVEAPAAQARPRRPWSVGLGVRWDGGRFPSGVPGLQLEGAWSRGPWSVGARAFGWPPSTEAGRQGTAVTFFGLGGGALGCVGWAWAVRPEACLAADLWTIRAAPGGVDDPDEPWTLQVAVAARLQATWPARGAWALRLAGELGVELNPARFRVEPIGEVHRVQRLLPGGSASVIFRP